MAEPIDILAIAHLRFVEARMLWRMTRDAPWTAGGAEQHERAWHALMLADNDLHNARVIASEIAEAA